MLKDLAAFILLPRVFGVVLVGDKMRMNFCGFEIWDLRDATCSG